MMEAVRSSESSVPTRATWSHILESGIIRNILWFAPTAIHETCSLGLLPAMFDFGTKHNLFIPQSVMVHGVM
jgi:hypothetical protein